MRFPIAAAGARAVGPDEPSARSHTCPQRIRLRHEGPVLPGTRKAAAGCARSVSPAAARAGSRSGEGRVDFPSAHQAVGGACSRPGRSCRGRRRRRVACLPRSARRASFTDRGHRRPGAAAPPPGVGRRRSVPAAGLRLVGTPMSRSHASIPSRVPPVAMTRTGRRRRPGVRCRTANGKPVPHPVVIPGPSGRSIAASARVGCAGRIGGCRAWAAWPAASDADSKRAWPIPRHGQDADAPSGHAAHGGGESAVAGRGGTRCAAMAIAYR